MPSNRKEYQKGTLQFMLEKVKRRDMWFHFLIWATQYSRTCSNALKKSLVTIILWVVWHFPAKRKRLLMWQENWVSNEAPKSTYRAIISPSILARASMKHKLLFAFSLACISKLRSVYIDIFFPLINVMNLAYFHHLPAAGRFSICVICTWRLPLRSA